MLCSVDPAVRTLLDGYGLTSRIGPEYIFGTLEELVGRIPVASTATTESPGVQPAKESVMANGRSRVRSVERAGVAARQQSPPAAIAGWTAASDRPEPVELILGQATTRMPDLVPVRHGRMSASPFAFYRGGRSDGRGRRPTALERHPGPGVRRRASRELRPVRVTRAGPPVRRQRLRRDPDRRLGMGRDAAVGQPCLAARSHRSRITRLGTPCWMPSGRIASG